MRKGKAKNQVEAESEGRIERRLRKVQVQGEPRSKKLQDWELLLSIKGSNQEKSSTPGYDGTLPCSARAM